jgi:uncharacterized protein
VIVGFDPGTASALAVIDLKGKLLFSKSFKGGLSQATRLLSSYRPSVVASDRREMESVRKLAASFGAVAFFPKKDMDLKEKAALVKGYGLKDQHQKDALAAALHAYKHYRRLIDRVMAREREIFDMLIKDELANISRALEPRRRAGSPHRKRDVETARRVEDLQRKLELTRSLLDKERREHRELKSKIKGTRRVVRRVKSPVDAAEERKARRRLDKELMASHSRLGKIEAELKKLRKATPEEKEDISQRVISMMREYKERFRK